MEADALSRKSSGSLAHISFEKRPLIQELHKLVDQGLMMKISISGGLLAQFRVRSVLRDRIKAAQRRDPILVELKENVRSEKFTDFTLDDKGILWISGRLCVPDVDNLKEKILEEVHFCSTWMYTVSCKCVSLRISSLILSPSGTHNLPLIHKIPSSSSVKLVNFPDRIFSSSSNRIGSRL